MKSKFFYYLLFALPINIFAQEKTNQYDEYGLQTGLWVDSTTIVEKPGAFYEKTYYKSGKREGKQFIFTGITYAETDYHNDTCHGVHKVLRLDSTLYQIENFKMGKLHGKRQFYDNEGVLFEESLWEDGKPLGQYHSFYKNGNIKSEIITVFVGKVKYEMETIFADDAIKTIIAKHQYVNRPVLQDGPVIIESVEKDFETVPIKKRKRFRIF
jgi:antitoxin component YwqK of YwqJK toxin-antitoxin module